MPPLPTPRSVATPISKSTHQLDSLQVPSVAITPEMTPDKSQDWQELPTPTTENKPLRTYSQKGKSNRSWSLLSLPPLKPTPKKFTPPKAGIRLERFHTDNANMHRKAFGHYGVDDDVDELALEDFRETSYLEYEDHSMFLNSSGCQVIDNLVLT